MGEAEALRTVDACLHQPMRRWVLEGTRQLLDTSPDPFAALVKIDALDRARFVRPSTFASADLCRMWFMRVEHLAPRASPAPAQATAVVDPARVAAGAVTAAADRTLEVGHCDAPGNTGGLFDHELRRNRRLIALAPRSGEREG